jgi:predicted alpha/beta hydrolase
VARDLRIPATDGFPLAATLFEPAGTPRALVTVNGATAVPRRFYAAFAEFLAARGHLVATFDYRGMGESVPCPDARMRDWGEKDLAGVLAWAQKEHPRLPLAAIGHSAGGQILALAEGAERYQALVGVAAQTGHWRYWPAPLKWRRAFDWHVLFPLTLALAGRIPAGMGLGDGLPKGVAAEWARWCRHREYILSEDGEARRARLARCAFPFLSYSFADDTFGPKAAADWLAAQYVNAKMERRHIAPAGIGAKSIGHMGFFREKQGGALWAPTAEWLESALTRRS